MIPQSLFVVIIVLAFLIPFLLMLIVILVKKRKEIDAFFHPGRYFEANIITTDGLLLSSLEPYPEEKPIYTWQNKSYFLTSRRYTAEQRREALGENKGETEDFDLHITPHRSGRIAAYYWREDDCWPRDLRTGKAIIDPALIKRLEDLKLEEMFAPPPGLGTGNLILLIVGAAVIILLLILVFREPEKAAEVATATAQPAAQVIVR